LLQRSKLAKLLRKAIMVQTSLGAFPLLTVSNV
jgi:hypothetical protein